MSDHRPLFEIIPTHGFDIWLHSYFLTGLIALSRQRIIRLRYRAGGNGTSRPAWFQSEYPLLVLRHQNDLIAFDPADRSDQFHEDALRECRIYFKRSFYPSDAARFPTRWREKIRPLNPMFATWIRSRRWTARTMWVLFRQPDPWPRRRRALITFCQLSQLPIYEATPVEPKKPYVLFQTRLWNPAEEKGDWVAPTNAHRVELVRALRRELGDRLVGGLIREPYAEQHYPDLITNLTLSGRAKRPEFIRLCRQFLVRINIRALFDAIPYSLGETLAANNCLVSEPIRNTCALPLAAGQHYLSFTSPKECATLCRELLELSSRTRALREAAHEYYRHAVAPAAAMRTYLSQAGIL